MTSCDAVRMVVAGLLVLAANAVAGEPTVRSRPNAQGGESYELRSGERLQGRSNALGGEDIRGPTGTIRSRPNALGGTTYELPDGGKARSRPNALGGSTVVLPDGRSVRCRPNVLGGTDCGDGN